MAVEDEPSQRSHFLHVDHSQGRAGMCVVAGTQVAVCCAVVLLLEWS